MSTQKSPPMFIYVGKINNLKTILDYLVQSRCTYVFLFKPVNESIDLFFKGFELMYSGSLKFIYLMTRRFYVLNYKVLDKYYSMHD